MPVTALFSTACARLKIAGHRFSIVAAARLVLRKVQALRALLPGPRSGLVEAPSARPGHLKDTR